MAKNVVAIFGAGRIGKLHAENIIRNLPDVKIKYIIDIFLTPEAEAWAKGLGVEHVLKDDAAVFADPEVDAILIGSPTPTHSDLILKACAAKKDVFCEKPLDLDIDRIYSTLEAVEKAGIKFMMGFVRRFDHNHRAVHDAVAAGKVGKPELITITSRDPAIAPMEYIATSGGIYVDMMIHDFDMIRFLAMSEVVEVYAKGACLVDPRVADYGDVDTAIVTLTFENGALGVINNSRRANFYDQRTEVMGDLGCVQALNDTPNTVTVTTIDDVTSARPPWFFLERYSDAFATEMTAFFEALNGGGEMPTNGNDGLQSVLIAEACNISAREGRPVKISEVARG
ncbi:MAG: inositol 2-dehydrogenase [Christensenellales bacterium]|jgi:myo-inositol 2-dehydrogenase/D-chiro-inositol 1-dehydrogenase